MGSISVNKLGGLSLVVGPILAVVMFLLRPGGGLVGGSVDPADAEAAIGNLMANSDMASISFVLAPIGLILFLYGLRVLVENHLSGGNGEALGRYGVLFFMLALVCWITGSAMALSIAGGSAGAAAGAVYVVGTALNITGSLLGALSIVAIGWAISTRDDYNKIFALIVAAIGVLLAVLALMSGRDISMLQTTNQIGGIGYVVTVAWNVTLGLKLMKKG